MLQLAIFILALIFHQTYNLGQFLGLPKVNDYIDLTFSLPDLVIVWLSIRPLLKLLLKPNKNLFKLTVFLIVGLNSIWLSQNFSWVQLWHYLLVLSRLTIIITTIQILIRNSKSKILLGGLVIFGLFDHFLISLSLPVLLMFAIAKFSTSNNTQFFKKRLIYGILGYSCLNLLVMLLQIYLGRSLGLGLLGESVLDVQTIGGIAKQNLWGNLVILRGYGFFTHPNLTGFFSCLLLWLSQQNRFKQNLKPSSLKNLFQTVVWLTILLSFSRTAWVVGIVLLIASFVTSKKITFDLKNFPNQLNSKLLLASITLVTSLGLLFLSRQSSDIFRNQDLQTYWNTYSQLSLQEKIFGLGLGQYSFHLQQNFPGLQDWQWQPVHSVWLNLFIELGIFNIFLGGMLCVWVCYKHRPKHHSQNYNLN